ncbi:sensor histidine kinase [Salinibacter sp.]|uniref:sensor histidine kinase n=1 Tax=Salinibacter sp. TaxID=2065818 RepID=UPI0021E9453B|nr:HAMP domain-containing sensor histidine kinase [Salinibacter sp.]
MLNSFYAKLSALFLVLIVGLGVLLATFGVRAARQYADEVEQKLNRTLAEEMVPRFEPHLKDSIDTGAIEATIQDMTGINRRIEIYLLERDGTLKASFAVPDASIEQRRVDLAPVRRFMEGDELPIFGDDPMAAGTEKPFSAAHIEIMGQAGCYLYVILGSEQYASVASMVGESYILQTALWGLGLIVLVTAGVGLLLFRRLTKRLRAMQDVVADFEAGAFGRRVDVASNDEIGRLGTCFNRMADNLEETMEELRQADRMRRELVANVSHDLRSPIASIQGYLETVSMKDGDLPPEERQRYVTTALRNTKRLNTLVNELFELSKLETKQIEPTIESFSIVDLVQDVVMQYEPQAEAQGIDLRAEMPERHVRVEADIGLLERALSNLIDNALHYTPDGGDVRVRLDNASAEVCVEVSDTGPGIPEDDLPHIFERFYRVDKSRDRDKGGAGLGLAIAKTILELHGRTLEVESTVGEGTVFRFRLPVEAPSGPEA